MARACCVASAFRRKFNRSCPREPPDQAGETAALIDVLRAIGPPAIPSLVAATEMSTGWTTFSALDAIVRMEPRSVVYGQVLNSWVFWRPLDDRVVRLERAVVPLCRASKA